MSVRWYQRVPVRALVATVCALAVSGCASWQLPRIDPSGERIFIMPGEPPPPYTGPVAPGALQPPPPLPPTLPPGVVAAPPVVMTPPPPPPSPVVGMPAGNMQAAPVYADGGLAPTPTTTFGPPNIPPPPGAPPITTPPPTPISPAVDAQWAIPASTTAEGGRALILTTNVHRRSDGAPLAGWVVRYEVTGAAATVARTGGNFIDVPTDASGRASVEVSPSDVGGGTAIVNVILLPPTPQGGTPVELARGSSTINWSPVPAGSPIGLPPPPLSGPPLSGPQPSTPFDTRPTLPADTPIAGRYGQPSGSGAAPEHTYTPPPPPAEKPAGKPRLDVQIRTTSPEPAKVGEYARFEVTVTNRGDGPARGIKVLDRFDAGLEHSKAEPNESAVKYENMRDLPAGEFDTVPLTFKVTSAGRLCHRVTVTAEGAAPGEASSCITAIDPTPATPPTLEVTKQGPIRQYVGDVARFKVIVKNSGLVPVTNLEIVDQYDAALDPVPDSGLEEISRGRLVARIERMIPGERRAFDVQCSCVAPASSACSRVTVKADGGVSYVDEKCVEILPLMPPTGRAPTITPPAVAASNLNVSVVESAGPARVGSPLTLFVFVENKGTRSEHDVALRVLVPQEVSVIAGQIQPLGRFKIAGEREIQFTAIPELRAGEKQQFEVPVHVDRAGNAAIVWAQIAAAGLAQPVSVQSKPLQILPAGP